MSGFSLNLKKDLARSAARKQAREYGGQVEPQKDFDKKFDTMFDLFWMAYHYCEDNADAMKAAAAANRRALADVVARAAPDPTGIWDRRSIADGRTDLRRYRVAPRHGRYVVFSDLHMTQDDNRQNFFARSGLKALYLDILRGYYAPEGFALVENGDVEELLIYEPDLDTLPKFKDDNWEEILADRETRKMTQFGQILRDHADYYRLIADLFIARDAYYRTIGNHDYDLADARFTDRIKADLGLDWPLASDLLLLADGDGVAEILCHGHQFDESCTQPHAPKAGESISQGNAWAFQGADRNWSNDKDGAEFLNRWRAGSRTLTDNVVDAATDHVGIMGQIWFALGNSFDTLDAQDNWESLLTHQVAWEYFHNADDPQKAVNDEVDTGIRYFKFRHMSETALVEVLDDIFPAGRPRLTLGHSHEPRLRPGRREMGETTSDRATLFMTDEAAAAVEALLDKPARTRVEGYLNAGSAGRFEDLLWGIEFDAGVATLVSWSRAEDGVSMVRTRWADEDSGADAVLRAAHSVVHQAAPMPTGLPLAAILNLLLS